MEDLSKPELRAALHDFNNVFTVIVSVADLLLLDMPKNSQAADDLNNILQACLRGKRIVEDIRTKAKV